MAQKKAQIASIFVDRCIPVYDNGAEGRPCFFDTAGLNLFDSPQPSPAAVSFKEGQVFHVTFDGLELGKHMIQAHYDKILLVEPVEVTKPTQLLTINLKSQALPCALRGDIKWQIGDKVTGDKTKIQWKDLMTTRIELYCLSPKVPFYVEHFGLPLSLLRQEELFSKWTLAPTAKTWEEHVINALFRHYPIWYEVIGGAPKYSTFSFGDTTSNHIPYCWLDLWLSDMDGLRDRKDTTTKYTVNCNDLAALAYVIITLGVSDYSAIRVKYLSPYGYINKTELIGRGTSNNPFFTSTKDIYLTKSNDPLRRPFSFHLFLAKHDASDPDDPYVLDACCGPETGPTKLSQYFDKAIDKTSALYDPKTHQQRGTIYDVADGLGVIGLATGLAWEHPEGGRSAEPGTLLNLMSTLYSAKPYTIYNPFIGSTNPGNLVVATWTIANGGHRISVNIYRHQEHDDAETEYTSRRYGLDHYKEASTDNDLSCNLNGGGLAMFHHGLGYLVTIESDTLGGKDLLTEANKIKKQVISKVTALRPGFSRIDPPKAAVTKGMEFSMEVFPEKPQNVGASTPWWRGYQLGTSTGNALRIKSHPGANATDNSAVFTFLARKAGWEFIKLTMYDADLGMISKNVSVYIQPAPAVQKDLVPKPASDSTNKKTSKM